MLEKEVLHLSATPCLTKEHSLIPITSVELPVGIPEDIAAHLTELYGPAAGEVYAYGADRLISTEPYLAGELTYLKEHEMAETWEDVLARRWGISLRDESLAAKLQATKKEAFASSF